MANEKEKVLEVNDLTISFKTDNGLVRAVRGVSFDLTRGETLCIVGESGSGKSVTSKTIMGILASNAIVDSGSIIYNNENLLEISEEEFCRIRGHKIGMIFQDPLSSLNPIVRIGKQITEATLINANKLKRLYEQKIYEELVAYKNQITKTNLKITNLANKLDKELAETKDKEAAKKLVKEYKQTISEIKAENKEACIPLKKALDDKKKVAKKEVQEYAKAVKAEYLEKVSKLNAELAEVKAPALAKVNEVKAKYSELKKEFYANKKEYLAKFKKEKKTLQLQIKTDNTVVKKYDDLLDKHNEKTAELNEKEKALLAECEAAIANAREKLTAVEEKLNVAKNEYIDKLKITKAEAKRRALEIMREVGIPLPEKRFRQYPFEFSGGMRQRIVIAIALTVAPEILICDEPTTALDVTIQAQILELIKKIQKERNLSVIFITHDLGVVANMADRVAVMYAGKIVEYGKADEIFFEPKHPYTWALLSSIPDVDSKERLEAIPGTPPNMIYPPKGDAFALRSKYAMKVDFEHEPPYFKVSDTHYAATWLLHPDAPKVEMPKIVSERIKNSLKNKEAASNE